jgi:ubiquinone/menaquinone biosynthesis C-methylase UbiE
MSARYDFVAQRYDTYVLPLYRPVAERLIAQAGLRRGDQVLDVGTGTGVAALLAAPKVLPGGNVLGIDLSAGMLAVARAKAAQFGFDHVAFRQGNTEVLDLPDGSFDVVLSAFGLAATDPARSLPEIRRVLASGGRLVFHEWGGMDAVLQAFSQTLRDYRVAEPSPWLVTLRATDSSAGPWERLDGPRGFEELVREAGFRDVHARLEWIPFRFTDPEAYYEVYVSFPLEAQEVAEMSETVRVAFRAALFDRLGLLASPAGLIGQAGVVFVSAVK